MNAISLRTIAFAAPFVSAIAAFYGCAPDDPPATTPPLGSGGSGATAGSTPVGSSGSASISGASTGGSSGGSTPNAAGTGPGTAGSSGASSMAGSGGTGGPGTAGSGGLPGTAGTGGGGGTDCADSKKCIDDVLSAPSSFGNPGWKDSWWVTGCVEKHDHDCYTITVANGCNKNDPPNPTSEQYGAKTLESFPVGGTPGQRYKVTFRYNGINEGKAYTGGKKDAQVAGDVNTKTDNDSFYRDGSSPSTNYNVIKLTVFDDKNAAVRHFYMNAFSQAQEDHLSFSSSYEKSIVIVGGGHIEHFVQDKNCHAIDNCNTGTVAGSTCTSPRRLPGADGQLMLPAMYADPNDGGKVKSTSMISISGSRMQPWKAQASHLTVTAIAKTDDPVTKDY